MPMNSSKRKVIFATQLSHLKLTWLQRGQPNLALQRADDKNATWTDVIPNLQGGAPGP